MSNDCGFKPVLEAARPAAHIMEKRFPPVADRLQLHIYSETFNKEPVDPSLSSHVEKDSVSSPAKEMEEFLRVACEDIAPVSAPDDLVARTLARCIASVPPRTMPI